ncbi:MAG: glycosyltransferase [Syntrophobacteraceae bacterium]
MRGTVLITTFGSLGDINPYVALASELKERGYSPIIGTSGFYRDMVEKAGIDFRPIRPDVNPEDYGLIERVMHSKNGPEILIREVLLPQLRKSYQDLLQAINGADILITHPITFAGSIVAEKTNIPWVSTILAPFSLFSAYDLPVFPLFPFLKNLDRFGPSVGGLVIRFAKLVARNWSEPIRRLRAEMGLPPGRDPIFEGQFSPELVLGLFSPLLTKRGTDWPQNARITGFLFNDKEADQLVDKSGADSDTLGKLERFLESGPPPVVFTLGSSAVMAAGDFYKESVEAARMLGIRAVLLVGRHPRNLPAEPLPDDIALFEYLPYSQIFPGAAAIVHQGGIGTTAQALRAGKPMLVVPFAFDQPDNAYRVTRLGVAGTIYRHRYSAHRAATELKTLLSNTTCLRRAEQVGEIVRAEKGVAVACDAIEMHLRR